MKNMVLKKEWSQKLNIALSFALGYIYLSPTLFMPYFPYSTCGK